MAALELLALNESTPQVVAPQAGDTATLPLTLNAATGDEVALDLSVTVNKATSGNYTGLKLDVTETAAPGSDDRLLDLQKGGVSQLWIKNSAELETIGNIRVQSNNVGVLVQQANGVYVGSLYPGSGTKSGLCLNGTLAVPAVVSWSDGGLAGTPDVVLSRDAAGVLALTSDGSDGGSLKMDLTTEDRGFINFAGTADADATSAISTFTTSAATTHHIQVEINGVTAWIAASTTDPTA